MCTLGLLTLALISRSRDSTSGELSKAGSPATDAPAGSAGEIDPESARDDVAGFLERTVLISGASVTYRVPAALSSLSPGSADLLPIGVLSGYRSKRNQVRATWGKASGSAVFFLVARKEGQWPLAEFDEFQDMILLDLPEVYSQLESVLPTKVQAWFHAAHTFLPDAPHVMKTDDDSFIDVASLRRQLRLLAPAYWGHVFPSSKVARDARKNKWALPKSMFRPKVFPPYCTGAGYVLSNTALGCMLQRVEDLNYIVLEDVATGILAQQCGVEPIDSGGVIWVGTAKRKLDPAAREWIVIHRVDDMEQMERTLRKLH